MTVLIYPYLGINIILHLHKILCINEEWIQRNLGIPEMLSPDIVVNQVSPSPLMRIGFDTPRESKDVEVQPSNNTALSKLSWERLFEIHILILFHKSETPTLELIIYK